MEVAEDGGRKLGTQRSCAVEVLAGAGGGRRGSSGDLAAGSIVPMAGSAIPMGGSAAIGGGRAWTAMEGGGPASGPVFTAEGDVPGVRAPRMR